jgi:2-desacetyl-2-hydroxyethyl bacteriochlorophyllide A dehydrogenase
VGTVVRFEAPGKVALVDCDDPALDPDSVRIATLHSGISAGTELTAYTGTNPYTRKRWDATRRLYVDGEATHPYPLDAWGYEEVGRVVEAGTEVTGVGVGDVIYGIWGHRSGHVASAEWAAARVLPADADPLIGVFARIGAIALNAVHDAAPRIGDVVAVFGQGVPGLLVTQLLRLAGATVVAVDAVPRRLELARTFGAEHVVDFSVAAPAEYVKDLTGGRGADVTIEISGSHRALHEAIRATAYNSRVVASGFPQGEATGLVLSEEFHHNRIAVVCSQISGVNPAIDHRWDVRRLERTVIDLATAGRLDVTSLVTHRFAAADVATAFALLAGSPSDAVQVVLDFAPASGREIAGGR